MNTTTNSTATGQVAGELREARKARGLTQAQLAGLAGCSLSIIGAIEAGAVPRQSAVVERVRDVLATIPKETP